MISKAQTFLLLLIMANGLLIGCVEQTAVSEPNLRSYLEEPDEYTFKHFQFLSYILNDYGIYHNETRAHGAVSEIPENRDQIRAGVLSNLAILRQPIPRLYINYPDVLSKFSNDSYLENLETGEHVAATITAVRGYSFVFLEPVEDLERSVIYCLPADLSKMADTNNHCFASVGLRKLGEVHP